MLDFKRDDTIKDNYIEEINNVIKKYEKTYYIGIGSLTNLSNYLKNCKIIPSIELVQMGGSANRREHNFNLDYNATKYVFSQDIKITLITSEITNNEKILITSSSPLYNIIQNSDSEVIKLLFLNIINFDVPFFLHDPLTLSYIINDDFLIFQPAKLSFLNSGEIMYNKCFESNIKISISAKYNQFIDYVYQIFNSLSFK